MLITTGGSEAILFALMSCVNPGEEVITPEPFYANYNGFATTAGIKIVPVTSYIKEDFALPPIKEIEKKITSKTKGIIVCNPNNPTGYLYSKEELLHLKEIVKRHDLFLFSDEAYREFCYDGAEHFSAMNLEGIDNNVIMLDSVSKRYSECGVRIGALITKNKDVISTALKFAQARLSPPGLGQIAGEASIDTPDEYFKEVNREYTAEEIIWLKLSIKYRVSIALNQKELFILLSNCRLMMPTNLHNGFLKSLNIIIRQLWLLLLPVSIQLRDPVRMRYG